MRSARTSSPTRCRASSSAVSSARSAGCGSPLRSSRRSPTTFATTLTFFAFLIIVLGGLGRVKGPIVGTVIFFFVIQFVDSLLDQANPDRQHPGVDRRLDQLRHREVHRRRARARPAGHLPSAGHLRRQASRRSMSADVRLARLRRRRGRRSPTRSSSPTESVRRFGGLVAVDVDHVEIQRNPSPR